MPGICASVLGVSQRSDWSSAELGAEGVQFHYVTLLFGFRSYILVWEKSRGKRCESVLVWSCLLVCFALCMEEGVPGKLVVILHAVWNFQNLRYPGNCFSTLEINEWDIRCGFVILLHASPCWIRSQLLALDMLKSVCAAEKLFLNSRGYHCWPRYSFAYCLNWRSGNDCVIFCNSC